MKIWTVAAQKGGVGKTTTTVSLAGSLHKRGWRTLMVDLDPHGSLTSYLGLNPDVVEPNAYTLFDAAGRDQSADLADSIHPTRAGGFDLVPSSTALISLERRFGQKQGMGLVLARALKSIAGRYDFCLIDCPPTLGVLVVNALVCCEKLIVPVQTEFLAAQSVDRLLGTITMIEKSRGQPLPYVVVPTMFDRRTRASNDTVETLRMRRDIKLWDDVIPVDTQFREASRLGRPLTTWQPNAKGSQAYERLLEYVLENGGRAQLRIVG
ncbi:MAG: ParA family protein [Gammaproteobacteria bacterium]|nr:ParA family protein [Gammaproteobacteria bacterium]MBI5615858.1 ParA family protein [Gammaproteobacteria bacterium]